MVSVGEGLWVQGWRNEAALDLRIVGVRRLRSWRSQRVSVRRSLPVLDRYQGCLFEEETRVCTMVWLGAAAWD